MYALQLEQVSKQYDGFLLDSVSFALPGGCIMGFIGENGAGKSTTIKLILDLIHADSGSISVLGQNISSAPVSLKEDIGVVLDESCFPELLTVKNVRTILKHTYRNWDDARFTELTARFALPMGKKIKELSKGMKVKLSIAAALSHHAKLLIMDEPASGLDPIVRDELLDLFLEFIQDEEHSVFLSSHIISDLEKICDYITLIHKGKILLCEEKDRLLQDYGILRCSQSELAQLPASAVRGVRNHQFGTEALVQRHKIPREYPVDPASIEEIMVFLTKEKVK